MAASLKLSSESQTDPDAGTLRLCEESSSAAVSNVAGMPLEEAAGLPSALTLPAVTGGGVGSRTSCSPRRTAATPSGRASEATATTAALPLLGSLGSGALAGAPRATSAREKNADCSSDASDAVSSSTQRPKSCEADWRAAWYAAMAAPDLLAA